MDFAMLKSFIKPGKISTPLWGVDILLQITV